MQHKVEGQIAVYFFGGHNFGWVPKSTDNLQPYPGTMKSNKTKLFQLAIKEIEDPLTWPRPEDYCRTQDLQYDVAEVEKPKKRRATSDGVRPEGFSRAKRELRQE
jgi:hypothetical protein